MALLSLIGAHKSFDADRPLLRGVDLTVRSGDRIGLIGTNGCGKSTLMRVLLGSELLEEGERVQARGLKIGYLEQAPVFEGHLTIRSAVRSGIEGRETLLIELEELHDALSAPGLRDEELQRKLSRQEILQGRLDELGGHDIEHLVEGTISGVGLTDPEALCKNLSGGELRRVALARLLLASPDLFLLDEPTNHLDTFVIAWLEERLRLIKAPLVLVTHDRYLLDRTVDRIVEIDQGRLHFYEGGYAKYVEQRSARLANEAQAERSRLLLLRRETEWMSRGPKARSTKAKARIQRYEELVNAEPEERTADLQMQFVPGPRLGNKVIELRGVSHSYGDAQIVPPLDLEITPGMRLGIVGPNGAGKTTLLKIIEGHLQPTTGKRIVGETVALAAVDQHRSSLDGTKTVVEEIAGDGGFVSVGSQRISVASFLEQFLFPGALKHLLIEKLSGGERGRVIMAKLLLAGGNVLLLDEPTNDLDLATLRALEEALAVFAGTVIVVSHDRWFLDRVATHILHLDGEGEARLHHGDVSELLEQAAAQRSERERAKQQGAAAEAAERAQAAKSQKQGPARLSNWERAELDKLTGSIAALEAQLGELDSQLSAPDLYRNGNEKALQLTAEHERATQELDGALERWAELAERE